MAKWTLPKTPDMIPRAEVEAMVAAALREAAEVMHAGDYIAEPDYPEWFVNRYQSLLTLIPDAGKALDRALAEQREKVRAEMETLVRKHIYYDSAGSGFAEDAFDDALAAIRAQK